MYPDRKRIRDNRLTVRFDDYEEQLMRALAAYLGEQPTTLIRELALRQAEELLGICLLYTSPSPRDQRGSRMPSSA